MTKILSIIAFLAAVFLFPVAVNAQAEEETDVQKVVRQRVENFFQAIRAEKWDELYEFVVLVDRSSKEKKPKRVTDSADDTESRKLVAERLKAVYGRRKPGQIVSIWMRENNTKAGIGYMHGDKDGFDMLSVDGEWYYTLEIWQ